MVWFPSRMYVIDLGSASLKAGSGSIVTTDSSYILKKINKTKIK